MEKTRRNRTVAVLGAGGVMATVFSAAGPAALAQPAFARAPALKVCPAIEALVSDGVSGPGPSPSCRPFAVARLRPQEAGMYALDPELSAVLRALNPIRPGA
jgi:hypothetical protein